MNNKFKALSVLLLGSFLRVGAQEVKQLSLTEAVSLGVANSKYIRQSDARIASAVAEVRELQDRRLPSASISGSYLRVTKPTINLMMNLGGSDQGGGSGSGSGSGGSQAPQVKEAMYALGNVSFPIFDGFKNSASIRSAKYLLQASKLDAETDRRQVIANITDAYSNLYKAQAALALVNENLKQAKQRTHDFENLEKNGLMARNDLLKAKLQESNVQLALLDAESDSRITMLNMNLLLGLPEQTNLVLDTNSFDSERDNRTLADWEQLALANRSDVQAADLRRAAAAQDVRAAKGDYYPSLALSGGYLALNVPNAIQVTDAWNAGLGLRYNISSLWKTAARVNAAKARLQATEAAQAISDDNLKTSVYTAYERYMVSLSKIETLKVAVEQANENYKILKNKYDNSLATTTDLLDADVQQLQAKLNAAYAKADARVAYAKLLQAAGVLNQ